MLDILIPSRHLKPKHREEDPDLAGQPKPFKGLVSQEPERELISILTRQISHMESPVPTSPSSLATSSTPLSFKTPTPSPAPFQYPEPPDEFVQDNITYLNREKTTKKAARLGSSHVWKYGLRY
ncbi:hypothetical protein HZ326_2352, partial [Fusarium oxysporum f. sp. albedinis]